MLSKLYRKLYNLVDKGIVVPISRFIYYLNKRTRKSRGWMDKLLNKPNFLIYLSLVLAVVVFLLVDNQVINLVQSQAETISVSVAVKYNSEMYVVEGIPETVDITISGSREHIYLAKLLGQYHVELDLTEYSASDSPYRVDFKYTKPLENLTYKISPSYANVIIKTKVSQIMPVTYDLLNLTSLPPELNVKSVDLDTSEVSVKGSEEALAKVAVVKALVDLKNQGISEVGTYTVNNLKFVAYDNEGKLLSNVEIVTSKKTATITLDSYSKKLPIEIITEGELIAGKAIASIQINGSDSFSVTAYGDKDLLDTMHSLPISLNIDGYGKNTTRTTNVEIRKQTGIRHLSTEILNISLTFGDEEQKTIEITEIVPRGLDGTDLTVNTLTTEKITVQVKGVESVIEDINPDDIVAYVDLTGKGKGEHEVEVQIDNKNPLVTYVPSTTIRVKIS